MRASTTVIIGMRNIGDAADLGTFHEMTLRDALAQMIQWMGNISMATRLQVVVARNQEEANRGLGLTPGKGRHGMNQARGLLDDLLADFGDGVEDSGALHSAAQAPVRHPHDDYED